MLTLTFRNVSGSTRVRDWLWLTASARIRDFFRRWRHEEGAAPRFLWVLERHQSGFPHFHVALAASPVNTVLDGKGNRIACGPSLDAVRHRWLAVGGGPMVHWMVLKGDGAYIAKYLDKGSILPEDLKALLTYNRIRLHGGSPGLTPQKAPSQWDVRRGSRGTLEVWLDGG
jgi:hypothetical protein